jgi:agmatine deiminase
MATDWASTLSEAQFCLRQIIESISRFEDVVVLLNDKDEAFLMNNFSNPWRIHPIICATNDTWTRDFGPLFIEQHHQFTGLDFKFNGWGLKFAADSDNLITSRLFDQHIFTVDTIYENHLNFVLEGGSIESDGKGTILTTSECLMSPNRNGGSNKFEIEKEIKDSFGAQKVLWLDHGYLASDDTDGHIDTLARFCNSETIAYIKCIDPADEHFDTLQKMENQLRRFSTTEGKPYNLIALPMADPVFEGNQRLPATYANFLIINGAVLVPFYNSPKDQLAKETLASVFPGREVIGIDCRPLIKQNGSLHCVTMQLPKGVLNKNRTNHAKNRPHTTK